MANANPNWPLVCNELDATLGPPNTPGPNRVSLNAGYRGLQTSTIDTDRGRVWELDHAQTGTLTASIKDPREILNPDNAASPLNTGGNTITSYRAGQVYAVWPNQPGSGNLLNVNVNPIFDPSFGSTTGGWVAAGGTTTLSQTGAQHFDGLSSLSVNQSGAAPAFGILLRPGLAPGIQYTFSAYVYPTGGCSVAARVKNGAGIVSATSITVSVQNTWTRVSFTWIPLDTAEQIVIYGTVTSTPSYYVDATQLEFGPTANTFTTSGPTAYNLITHYVERYPTTYDMMGTRAIRPLAGVDALGILNNTVIDQSYDQTIAADNPTYYFPLSNAAQPANGAALSNSGQVTDINGNTTIAPQVGRTTNGIPTYLINGAINWGADTQPDGTPAVQFLAKSGVTELDVIGANFSADTANGLTVETWAKVSSGAVLFGGLFVLSPANGNVTYGPPPGTVQMVFGTNQGSLSWAYDPTGSALQSLPTGLYPAVPIGQTAQWHYYASTLVGGVWKHMIDGVETSTSVASVGTLGFTYLNHIEATTAYGDSQSQVSVARFAVYPTDIGLSRRQAHYNRGIGYLGELAGARVNRLLTQYWGGTISTAPGVMTLAEDFLYDGQTLLNVLQGIESSERGLTYADRNGLVVFEDRTSRYSGTQTSLWTFGENPPSGVTVTEDASTPAVVTGTGTGNLTTASFSPPSHTLLLAMVAGGFSSGPSTTVAISDSGSHAWILGPSQNGAINGGVAAIYYTYLTSAPGSITVTATYTGLGGGSLLAVRVLNGAAPSQTGASATHITNSTIAAISITTTTTGSQVYGVSNDSQNNDTWTARSGTTAINNYNDVSDLTTLVAWKAGTITGAPGLTTRGGNYGSTATGDDVAFEVIPAGVTEYPYSDYQSDFDPTYVFTQANLTRPDNLAFAPIPNPPPVNPTYGQRIVQQEVQCTNDYDLTQAANSYLSRYAKPRTRISKLVLDPGGNPSLFPVVLSLEISQRITVKRRAGGAVISGDFYIEKISHSIDFASGKWLVTLQLSPVFVSSAWVMGDATFGILGTNTVPVY